MTYPPAYALTTLTADAFRVVGSKEQTGGWMRWQYLLGVADLKALQALVENGNIITHQVRDGDRWLLVARLSTVQTKPIPPLATGRGNRPVRRYIIA